jgi:putative transcriptional regulator
MGNLNIRKIRMMAGMSQADIANATGLNPAAISLIERGKRIPRPKTAKKIAAVLGFDWQKFYEGDE